MALPTSLNTRFGALVKATLMLLASIVMAVFNALVPEPIRDVAAKIAVVSFASIVGIVTVIAIGGVSDTSTVFAAALAIIVSSTFIMGIDGSAPTAEKMFAYLISFGIALVTGVLLMAFGLPIAMALAAALVVWFVLENPSAFRWLQAVFSSVQPPMPQLAFGAVNDVTQPGLISASRSEAHSRTGDNPALGDLMAQRAFAVFNDRGDHAGVQQMTGPDSETPVVQDDRALCSQAA